MAILATIPQTTLPIGEHDFGPHNVAGAIHQYVISLDISGWTFTGDVAFTYICQSSQDGGQTWDTETSQTVFDNVIPAKTSHPANRLDIACPIRGSGNRKVQFLSNWIKSLPISGTISAN